MMHQGAPLQLLQLLGREDLLQPRIDLRFQRDHLLVLIRGQFEALHRSGWQDVRLEAGRSRRSRGAASNCAAFLGLELAAGEAESQDEGNEFIFHAELP